MLDNSQLWTSGFHDSRDLLVNLQPWFQNSFKLDWIKIHEELGGKPATGRMGLTYVGDGTSIEFFKEKYKTGDLEIRHVESGMKRIIKLCVYSYVQFSNNYFEAKFCCINKLDFYNEKITLYYDDPIADVINSLYPWKKSIKIKSDISKDPRYFQNNETNADFCTKLCYSFKRDCIFAYGMEGLLLKDTMGEFNSRGEKDEKDKITLSLGTPTLYKIDKDLYREEDTSKPDLYAQEIDLWNDTENTEAVLDYSNWESKNLKVYQKYKNYYYFQKDYEPLYQNGVFNRKYQSSNYFHHMTIVNKLFPKYEIGDVVTIYEPAIEEDYADGKTKTVIQRLYLIKENSLEISWGANEVGEGEFDYYSVLVGLEDKSGYNVGTDDDITRGVSI